ncbi:DUF6702 family protein [Winogradskyella sp. SYSU M77433]|uniref:DUF6702 family protein n=1 Tax=Winogradskyella sp. SYSU M77433 TaxID=3042722 RepID=UPI0024808E8F|nr:DUF6702 family protein [Winogradskyella sp. SYSU M77433]MDH7911445.1 peptidase E [Winogradskyella sp. SYSU M77433]
MKLLQIAFAFFLMPLLTSNDIQHEYYVSVTEVEYVKDQRSVQIISQIFIDDFEKLLRERYDEDIILAPDNKAEEIKAYIKRYLEDKLQVKVNGQKLSFNYIGKEYKDDITYCYLEIENVSDVKTIEITNKVLFDILPAQQNIVRIKAFDVNKSFLLIPDNDECMLNFD